ncbi:MAG TPA: DUF3105 domain-containing protein, partial [Candidatus Limnocylindrales bacterium]|nr:DUF3105 domain-containing protein [Candidatus Limnocylindrales bacterium]
RPAGAGEGAAAGLELSAAAAAGATARPATTPPARPTARSSGAARPRSARTYRDSRPFLERHRMAVLGVGVLAIVLAVSGFVFFQATQPAYGCSTVFNPPEASSPSGAPQPDRGKTHINPGTYQAYDQCPPASGPHNTTSQFGPIEARYYSPDEQTVPQGWVHNLEHGALVVLYKCSGNECDDAAQSQLKQFATSFPPSPVCKVPAGVVSPVVARFDQLPHAFAAIVWDRVMYLDSWNAQQVLDFYRQYGERANPEPQCARPTAAPSASSAPSGSPAASGSEPASAAPSPSGS